VEITIMPNSQSNAQIAATAENKTVTPLNNRGPGFQYNVPAIAEAAKTNTGNQPQAKYLIVRNHLRSQGSSPFGNA